MAVDAFSFAHANANIAVHHTAIVCDSQRTVVSLYLDLLSDAKHLGKQR